MTIGSPISPPGPPGARPGARRRSLRARRWPSSSVFYDIYAAIEKDGEELELLAADGHFLWLATSGVDGPVSINHPILLKRVELRFDPRVPEFTIHETDREPEIYGSLFVDLQDVAPAAIAKRKNELEAADCHPFGWQDTDAFLQAFIQTVSPLRMANSSTRRRATARATTPRLLPRAGAAAAKACRRHRQCRRRHHRRHRSGRLPALAGPDHRHHGRMGERRPRQPRTPGTPNEACGELQRRRHPARQGSQRRAMQIIRRLEHSGSVLVQGPPGTGKTHTIGNLIGHLLAQGKSILVTAQTAKALRVVRDKVPEMLQPLAVSVLGSDQGARQQLESSITRSPSG
jgi:hypothetical protein